MTELSRYRKRIYTLHNSFMIVMVSGCTAKNEIFAAVKFCVFSILNILQEEILRIIETW